ncbi:SNARE associated Golgi family protein [Oscillatoria nigro-viridis PCC 7112]|uniref:TVP38/TMEM64 family membrane protein n=1 Tax=Phormidium nigroviride PCC 7112 TaxID=179408 RepID=K9VGS5_9CYAN|nr:TVP38/TMEM64 family protein [Oscillatoria nigro-viridis]AFZ07141.1 SNARE associated Golgi family protein [Oscillatoria nigro-viridis PCC 7112]
MAKERIQDYARVKFKRIVLFFSIALLLALLIVATRSACVQDVLRTVLMRIEDLGWWGPVAFVATYNLATVLFVPGSVLTLGGGAIFGLWWGSVYVFAASILGAVFAFAIGRYLCRDRVVKYMESHPKFKALDRAVSQQGLKIVFLTRLCPLFPFNLLNYALGITQVSLKDYVLGSFGMIPGTIMYVYSGSLVGDIAAIGTETLYTNPQDSAVKWLINIISFIATVAVTMSITRIARKALDESV